MILTIGGKDFRVEYTEDPAFIWQELRESGAKFFTFDTETTGLHIKKDRPFLGAVCFNDQVFVFPSTPQFLNMLPIWAKLVEWVWGHNMSYDMHMVANVVGDALVLAIKNWGDTMALLRLTYEAISARDGGDRMGLKDFGTKYVDRDANRFEKAVKAWLKAKEAANRKILVAFLKGIKDEGGVWTMKRFQAALDDGTLPDNALQVYNDWRKNYPKPTYQDVPMEIMLPYVAVDVILTQFAVEKASPVVEYRKQTETLERELRVLPIVWKMERAGLAVNRAYLQDCAVKLDQYIQSLYTELHLVTGMDFTVYQSKVIKGIYADLLGEEPKSVDKKFLKKMADKGDRAATIIGRLRRLEKWKTTYVERILEVSEYDGRFYTQMNQFNPVSGRFSGDAQQFPKDPIYTEEGYEFEKEHPDQSVPEEYILYHPRKAFTGYMYYLDYSQVELRAQAHYTLPFGGDLNLCRAYMPFKCQHYRTGEEYCFNDSASRLRWEELREGAPSSLHWEDALKQGWSAWQTEDGKPWVPTDVHTATTLRALRIMGHNPDQMDPKLVKWWRKKGKQFNFMRNYGGGDVTAAETLDITLDQAKAMNKGYTDAFPLVVTYQDRVIDRARQAGYVQNLYSRRYYLSNWNRHYKLANYLIQGSCADMLKEKMIQIDEFLTENGILWELFRPILSVHDELQFEDVMATGKYDWAIARIKAIMEDTPKLMVPIVAEAEVTKTNWAEKKPLHVGG